LRIALHPDHETTTIDLALGAEARRYVGSDASRAAKLMAARGALPLEATELASVLFALLHDSDEAVRGHASRSLADLPEDVCRGILESHDHPAVLAHFALLHAGHPDHLERIAANPATDDATLAYLASLPQPRVLERLGANEERLRACNALLEALGRNPLTGRATIERILAIADPRPKALAPSELEEAGAAEAAIAELLGEPCAHFAERLASESERDANPSPRQDANLFAAVAKMGVLQKIRLARLGGREARALLLRDRNKVVASAVVASPKITESEIVSIAQSRNIADEVLRRIAGHREWTRHYAVKHALAANPKTPKAQAIDFLGHLRERDLRSIARSRDVSSAIAAQARRVLQRRQGG